MNRKIAFSKNPRHLGQTLQYSDALTADNNQSKFRSEPQELLFTGYEANHTYESEIRLINSSKTIQRIKLTPLKCKEMVISNVKYPREDTGDIAPGMCVVISIRFRPITLNDYEDQLIVIVADGVLRIPIVGQREKCEINWPKIIDCGHCWVGNVIHKEITLKNTGGQATFSIKNIENASNEFNVGYFKVFPSIINFQKASS